MSTKAMDDLMLRIMVFVDQNGKVLRKSGNPMSSSLVMEYHSDIFNIKMHAYAHGMGNGSCGVLVYYQDQLVLDAGGKFMTKPFDVVAETYQPGAWEDKFPKV